MHCSDREDALSVVTAYAQDDPESCLAAINNTNVTFNTYIHSRDVCSVYAQGACVDSGNMSINRCHLWNPSIRQGKELIPARAIHPLRIGFGYDSFSCDYKVVKFGYWKWPDNLPIVQVHYVNSDCCREFEVPVLKNCMESIRGNIDSNNVSVNGVLYFDGADELVSFDLHDEVVRLLPFPSFIQRRKSNVLDFEGSVAMVFESGTGVDLWTLDNVSDEVYWTKKFSIDYGLDEPNTEIWLSCYLGAKQFFGSKFMNKNFFVYDVLYEYEKKETKIYGLQEEYVNILEFFKPTICPTHATMKYTETIVSLNGFEQVV